MEDEIDLIILYESDDDAKKVAEMFPDSSVTENIVYIPDGDPVAVYWAGELSGIEEESYNMTYMESSNEEENND